MLLNQRSQIENLSRKFGGTVGSSSNIRKVEIVKAVNKPVKPAPAAIPVSPQTPVQPPKRGCNCKRKK